MNRFISTSLALLLCANSAIVVAQKASAENPQTQTTSSFKPKDLSTNVQKGLAYLAGQQNADGSWSQGEESQFMRANGHDNGDIHNVADTCMASMALVRAGSYPNSGPYAKNLAKAVDYICTSIEQSDKDTLFITKVRNTRVQTKLGQYVDTFLASVFLPDIKGKMPDEKSNTRVAAALDKVIAKIEKSQGKDGSWASDGWAPVHSRALAVQGLNKSKRVGMKVSPQVLIAAENNTKAQFSKGRGFIGGGAAGVPLYQAGANLGAMQKSLESNADDLSMFQRKVADPKSSVADRRDAEDNLKRMKDTISMQNDQLAAVVPKLGDKGFVQGFGCNGGEEFLSYMQISDTLAANKSKAKEFSDWDKKITANINHVQLKDGSWMGQHCITSRTFCTAAAVLVLTADRSQLPRDIASSGRGQQSHIK